MGKFSRKNKQPNSDGSSVVSRLLVGVKGVVMMQPTDGRATYVQTARTVKIHGKKRALLTTRRVER